MNIKPVHGIAIGILALVAWLAASILWGASLIGLLILLMPGWAAAGIIWFRKNKTYPTVGILITAVLVFGALWIPDSTIAAVSSLLPPPLQDAMSWMLVLTYAGILSVTTLLLDAAFTLSGRTHDGSPGAGVVSTGGSRHTTRLLMAALILGVLTLARVVSNLYWFLVWDTTIDPLGFFWLFLLVPPVVCIAGVLLILLPGKFKLAGLAYLLFIPLIVLISGFAQRVDFRQLTAQRAEQVKQAIETYRAREGRYPDTLQQLFPRDTVSLAGPVILFGQEWCYQGGSDYYRLGYLDREHWSSPILFGHVYAATGHAPLRVEVCQTALNTYRAQHPNWDQVLQLYGRPTPVPDLGE